ncbi:phosphatidylinositol phosphate synthase [Nocardioides jiangxiensis]|uniref:Phosphatidylinositol phosphate synthase n=1 Tax=Nocardioides jiangxiensis TaxID=3064524 RepID=A0ABT9AWT7_9ACTN|nr:CDP-alcohol phosphatidyltransferase family protein [Nocardioides sp. WY-20]MDO7866944.1 CDP-alcohol phosphatidyltransferase family protein [Nocardioides sp. WY-20]
MLERFRGFWTAIIAPLAKFFLRLGISPDAVTIVGTFGVCAGALVFFPQGRLFAGVMFITAFVFSDLIDGHMARLSGRTTRFGAFLDSTLDRVADGAIFAGLALYFASPHGDELIELGSPHLYQVLCLIALVMGSVTSYVRAKAESLGMTAQVGIAERATRLVFTLVATGVAALFGLPYLIEAVLWFMAVTTTITVGQRIWEVRKQCIAEVAAQDASA